MSDSKLFRSLKWKGRTHTQYRIVTVTLYVWLRPVTNFFIKMTEIFRTFPTVLWGRLKYPFFTHRTSSHGPLRPTQSLEVPHVFYFDVRSQFSTQTLTFCSFLQFSFQNLLRFLFGTPHLNPSFTLRLLLSHCGLMFKICPLFGLT